MLFSQTFRFEQQHSAIYNTILNLELREATQQIETLKIQESDNCALLLLENYIDFLTLFISEEKTLFDQLQSNKNTRIKSFEKLSDENPYKLWAIATTNLQWAFVRLKFDEKYTATFEIRKAHLLLNENQNRFPEFKTNLLAAGFLHALFGAVPARYQIIMKLASLNGSIEKGRSELYELLYLTTADASLSHLRKETLFYLSFIEMNLNANKQFSENLLQQFSDNDLSSPLMIYAKATLEMRLGKNNKALETLSFETTATSYPFCFLDYLRGECLLRKLDFDAQKSYQKYISTFGGTNYITDAKRKIAWIYLLQGDQETYLLLMTALKIDENRTIDIDKQAVKEATSRKTPHLDLLKTQLLFDGGYYDEALQVIAHKTFDSEAHTLEQLYRMARIFDEQKNHEQARIYYQKTIEKGKNANSYFAANAALKIAEYYETTYNYSEAKTYYNLCLKMNPTEYRTSIHQKAKAGLSRLPKN
jgi:hypothetical protein